MYVPDRDASDGIQTEETDDNKMRKISTEKRSKTEFETELTEPT